MEDSQLLGRKKMSGINSRLKPKEVIEKKINCQQHLEEHVVKV